MEKPQEERRRRWLWWVIALLIILLLLLLRWCTNAPEAAQKSLASSATSGTSAAQPGAGRKPGSGTSGSQDADSGTGEGLALPAGAVSDWLARSISPQELQAFKGELSRLGRGGAALPVSGRVASPLERFLPPEINGAARGAVVSLRSQVQTDAGLLGESRALYGDIDAPSWLVYLADGGMAAAGAIATDFLLGTGSRETSAGSERRSELDGQPLVVRWRRAEREASAAVLLAGRLRAEVFTRDVDSGASAEAALRKLDLAGMQQLLKSDVSNGLDASRAQANDVGFVVGETLRQSVATATANSGGAANTGGSGTASLAERWLAVMPATLAGQAVTSRQSSNLRVGGAASVPTAIADYGADASNQIRIRVQKDPPNLGLLGSKDSTWQLMQRTNSDGQILADVDGRRSSTRVDAARSRGEFQVLLGDGVLVVATVTGSQYQSSAAIAQSLDWRALEEAVRQ